MTKARTITADMSLRGISLCAAATVILYVSGIFVLFTPLPLVYAYLAGGTRSGLTASGAAGIVMALLCFIAMPSLAQQTAKETWFMLAVPGIGLVDHFSLVAAQAFGIGYAVFFVVVAYAIGRGARGAATFSRWIGAAVFAGIAVIVTMAGAAWLVVGNSLTAQMGGFFESIVAEIAQLNESSGLSGPQIEYLAHNTAQVARMLTGLVPAISFVFVVLVVVLNALMGRSFVRTTAKPIARAKQAMAFRLPDHAVWALIASASLFFIDQYVLKTGRLRVLALNGIVVMSVVYFFQGFAVAAFFIEHIRMRFVRLALYITMAFFVHTLGILMVGVGLADVWVHFRQRIRLQPGGGA